MVNGDHQVNYQIIKDTMADLQVRELMNSSKGKNIVVLLGATDSGKSTLINYLCGRNLMVNEMDEIILTNPLDPTSMKIGLDLNQSETKFPQFIQSDDFLFYDLPGFGDTRGINQDLLNACFIKNIVENALTVRLLFVFAQDGYKANRQQIFRQQYAFIKNLIPDMDIDMISSVVMTKTNKGDRRQDIIRKVIRNDMILSPFVNNGRFAIFPIPSNGIVGLEDKQDIIDIIRKSIAIEIKIINVDVIYSDQTQNQLIDIFNKEIMAATMNQINHNYYDYDISTLSVKDLEKKKKYFEETFLDEFYLYQSKQPLIALLRVISESQYQASLNNTNMRCNITNFIARTLSDITYATSEAKANASWWVKLKKFFNEIAQAYDRIFDCGGKPKRLPNPSSIPGLREQTKISWEFGLYSKVGYVQLGAVQKSSTISNSMGGVVQYALSSSSYVINEPHQSVRESIDAAIASSL